MCVIGRLNLVQRELCYNFGNAEINQGQFIGYCNVTFEVYWMLYVVNILRGLVTLSTIMLIYYIYVVCVCMRVCVCVCVCAYVCACACECV